MLRSERPKPVPGTYLPSDLDSVRNRNLNGIIPSYRLPVWQVSFGVGYSRIRKVGPLSQRCMTVRSQYVEELRC